MADDRVTLAVILGPHGVRGDVRLKSFTDNPEDCFAYGPLKSTDGKVSIDAKTVRATNKGLIVTPIKPLQREEWQTLKGTEMSVSRQAMPDTEEDEFYIDDLVDMKAIDSETQEEIGTIKSVQDYGAGDILEIARKGVANLMIPLTEEDVPVIDLDNRSVQISSVELWDADNDVENDESDS